MKNYPHLTDATKFPGLGEPYAQYKNEFDYSRWTVGTELILCNVPWDSTDNVVDWTGTNLGEYADNLTDAEHITLNSEINVFPDGVVRIPLPVTNAQRWNYVIVRMTVPTTSNDPIDYADGPRINVYGYFIREVKQLAASTTECHIDIDYWSTYVNHIKITSMMLERGHAPMAEIDADEYLNNPLENNKYLLTDDVSFGEPVITTNTQFHSWCATTSPLIMFAVTTGMDGVESMLNTVPSSGSTTVATFSDRDVRWGKQWNVNNYDYGELTKYSNASVDTVITADSSGVPTGVNMFAVEAQNIETFLNAVQEYSPQLLTVVNSVYMITGDLVSTKKRGTFHGVDWYEVLPLNELPSIPIKLTKDDFGYDERYENIAKLYTYPYAGLTFSDNNGSTVDVRIEYTTPDFGINRRVSLAYPYIKAQAFINGYRSDGHTSYSWVDVNGIAHDGTMPSANWQETMIEYDIPSYALTMDGHTQWLLKNANSAERVRLQALNDYHTTVRGINTNYENTIDSAETTFGNAKRSADTTLSNAQDETNTHNTNTLESLTTTRTNSLDNNSTSKNNSDRSNSTTRENSIASADASKNNSLDSNATTLTNTNRSADNSYTMNENTIAANTDQLGYRTTQRTDNTDNTINVLANNYRLQDVFSKRYLGVETFPLDSLYDPPAEEMEEFRKEFPQDPSDRFGWLTNLADFEWVDDGSTAGQSFKFGINKAAMEGILDRNDADANHLVWARAQFNALAAANQGERAWDATAMSSIGSMLGSTISNTVGNLTTGSAGSLIGTTAQISNFAGQAAATYMGGTSKDFTRVQIIQNLTNAVFTVLENSFKYRTQISFNQQQHLLNLDSTRTNNDIAQAYDKSSTERGNKLSEDNATATRDTTKANAGLSKTTADTNTTRSYDTNVANTNRSYTTTSTNIDASKTTADSNTNRSYNTGKDNQDRTYKTAMGGLYTDGNGESVGTLKRSYDTTIGNITRTKNTTENNAGYSQDTSINTAQTKLQQAQDLLVLDSNAHKVDAPVTIGTQSGDIIPDLYGYRGVEVRVNTQPKAAIESAGSYFMRYGYALDHYWDVKTWSPMNHFTYWKARDVWMTGDSTVIQAAKLHIRDILIAGTTVWKKPSEIGSVDIYDNRRDDNEQEE